MTLREKREILERECSPAGGWTRKTLAKVGIPWPPPKGWRKAIYAEESKEIFAPEIALPLTVREQPCGSACGRAARWWLTVQKTPWVNTVKPLCDECAAMFPLWCEREKCHDL